MNTNTHVRSTECVCGALMAPPEARASLTDKAKPLRPQAAREPRRARTHGPRNKQRKGWQ